MKQHGWRLAAALVALLIIVPLAVVLASLFSPEQELWRHLLDYVLPGLLGNTLRLVLGVAIGVTLLGVSLAWLTAVCDFPGRRFFSWALLLPLALPSYVTAFVYVALLDFTGPLQTGLRELVGGPLAFPAIRSAGGVIMVMSLALYPYVYLLARNAFLTQGKRALEAAQSLGYSRRAGFFRVACLPDCHRPAQQHYGQRGVECERVGQDGARLFERDRYQLVNPERSSERGLAKFQCTCGDHDCGGRRHRPSPGCCGQQENSTADH